MEVFARRRYADMSAQKCRLVADQIRGLPVDKALNMLKFNQRKAAAVIKKLLESAIANAEHNEGADIDELKVSTVFVDEGPTAKRWHARARGRSSKIFKRSSHITVAVSDKR